MNPQGKPWFDRLFVPILIVLVGLASFGLGRLSVLAGGGCAPADTGSCPAPGANTTK